MAFLPLKKFLPPAFHNSLEDICGIDEVGRGCWAGPLVACALMLHKNLVFKKLRDSKQMTPQKREEVFRILQKQAIYGIGIAEVEEVDNLGLIKANNLAFVRALKALTKKHKIEPKYLVIDGRDKLTLPYKFKTIIKGDEKLKVIACASIIAKVTRDRMMRELARKYPEYGFEEHKGYGTERHHRALQQFGVTGIHRKSYRPVRELIKRECAQVSLF